MRRPVAARAAGAGGSTLRNESMHIAARFLVPYVGVWGAAGVGVMAELRASGCGAFCAVYAGSMSYRLILAALLLSTLVAAAQVLLPAR